MIKECSLYIQLMKTKEAGKSIDKKNRRILRDNLLHDSKEKKKTLADFYGSLPNTFGDGLAYQKKVRNEW
jgi:hypothetical protein